MPGIFEREESFVDGEITVREGETSREMFILSEHTGESPVHPPGAGM